MAWKSIRNFIVLGGLPLVASVAWGQATAPQSAPSDLLQKYQNAVGQWEQVGFGHAKVLFGLLAAIEVAWLASTLALERDSIESWLAPVLKKLMTIGFFWMILSSHALWLPAIINSFTQIGQEAGGVGNLTPSGILFMGLKICGNMLAAAVPNASTSVAGAAAALIPGVGTALAVATLIPALIVVICALLVFISYVVITIAFIMANVESYIAIGAGVIFLGFGASRWTVPYVERYFSLIISTGVRLMVIYMIIGLGQTLGDQWAQDANNLTLSTEGCQALMGIAAGALTFMAVAWSVPKLVASVVSGSLSMSAGDAFAPVAAAGVGVLSAGVGIATAGAGIAAMGAGAAATSAAGSAGAAMSGTSAAQLGGTLGAGTIGGAASGGGAAGGAGSAVMSTEAATQAAVNPLVAGGPATDGIGSVMANPPAPASGTSASAAPGSTGGSGGGQVVPIDRGGARAAAGQGGTAGGSGGEVGSSGNGASGGSVADGGGSVLTADASPSGGLSGGSATATADGGAGIGTETASGQGEASGPVAAPSGGAAGTDSAVANQPEVNSSSAAPGAPSVETSGASASDSSSGTLASGSGDAGTGGATVQSDSGGTVGTPVAESSSAAPADAVQPPAPEGSGSPAGSQADDEQKVHPLTKAAQAMQDLRGEAQVLSDHAPHEGPAISAPTLNIQHGE